MARISILAHWQQWPSLHEFYEVRSFLLPNIGTDLLMLGAAKLMPLELAGRAMVALTLATMLSGTVALHWSLYRRFSIWPLIGALFLYNWIFIFGFLNYLFGVGLMLWGLAIWIALADRPAGLRLAVGTVIAFAIFFAHLVSFGLYALALAGFELQRAVPDLRARPRAALARLVVGALPFAPPLLLFVALSPTAEEAGGQIKYAPEWFWKLFIVARTFMSMNLGLDVVSACVLLLVAVAVLLRGRLLFAREMLAGAALVAAAVIAVPWKMFGAVFVDARIPIALIFLVIACTQLQARRAWIGRAIYVVLGALLVARSLVLAHDWQTYDRVFASFSEALAQVPENSVIVTATAAPEQARSLPEWVDRWRPPVRHGASLALLEKPMFAVNTWATPSQQPIATTPRWSALYRFQEQNPRPVDSADELQSFVDRVTALIGRAGGPDQRAYLLLLEPDYLHYALPPNLTRVAAGSRFLLFRIDR
jgi:hypothetical protein